LKQIAGFPAVVSTSHLAFSRAIIASLVFLIVAFLAAKAIAFSAAITLSLSA
tara:strand:- start:696 stop:851 length:156 start_codon:yes stop_codon:yes gene_type:complete